MSYVDNLFDEIDQKASVQQTQIIDSLLDKVSCSMYGLKNLNHYVSMKIRLHRINKQIEFFENIGVMTQPWYDEYGNLHFRSSEKACFLIEKRQELNDKLYNSKLKAKGIRSFRKEILRELNYAK